MANNQSVRRHLDAFTRGRIIGKLEEGRIVKSVAAEFGIAHSIVSRLWRQFQTTGTAIRGFSSGRPRGTTPALLSKMATDLTAVNDEAHFWLNGYVNKQNCRIWSEANPQVYVETPLHPEKLTVWCALWAGGINPTSSKTMKATTLQSMVIDKPQTLDHLEDNIRLVIADIRLEMLEKVIENWTSRLDYIRASSGSPMPEIIFKM
ncbi:hypothetical protein TNCV_579241 [Trichonephila clavipes]|nr:hypothetical protein TNCV_579241 [Trichonephila clavipes]